MTESKKTKRELTASIVSVVLCLVMLVGLTFAWFTDSVTNKGNIIKSGNLNVAFEWANGTEALDTATWKDASGDAIFNYDAWEPGYTEVRHVRISNKGNLALKYEIKIVPNGEVSKLAEAIDVYYIEGGQQLTGRTDLTDANKIGTLKDILANPYAAKGHILAGGNADVATIALKMQESAGNDYRNLSIGSDFSVQLVATQYTKESDSFGSDYDADAGYPVSVVVGDKTDLDAALNNPGVPVDITLDSSIDHGEYDGIIVSGNATMNMGENSVLRNGMGQLISVKDGGRLTINAATPATTYYPTKETAGRLTTDGEGTALAVNGGYYAVNGGRENQGVVAAVNESLIKLTEGIYKSNHSRGAVVSANTGAHVIVLGGEYIAGGYKSSIFYADGGVIEITGEVILNRNGAESVEFMVVNGGKIMIAKTAVSSKPTSIGAGCTVVDDGENWVIQEA